MGKKLFFLERGERTIIGNIGLKISEAFSASTFRSIFSLGRIALFLV
jgi:hypothetical protein